MPEAQKRGDGTGRQMGHGGPCVARRSEVQPSWPPPGGTNKRMDGQDRTATRRGRCPAGVQGAARWDAALPGFMNQDVGLGRVVEVMESRAVAIRNLGRSWSGECLRTRCFGDG